MSNATQDDLENITSTFSDLISRVSKFSEEIGRMDTLRPIYDIISKSEGEPYEVYLSCISYLQKLKPWLEYQKVDYSTISSIDNSIRQLKKEEEKIGIPA